MIDNSNDGSENIPDLTKEEITNAMLNKKTPDEDGIVLEMIMYGGQHIMKMLEIIFSKCIELS